MASIVSTAFGQGVSFYAASLFREFAINRASWSSIRVAARFRFEDNGSTLPASTQLAIGLCSGATNPYDDTRTVSHFVGMGNFVTTSLWARDAVDMTYSSPNWRNLSKVGTTLSSGINSIQRYFSTNPNVRTLLMFDLAVSGANYSASGFSFTSASAPTDVTDVEFASLLASGSPSKTGYSTHSTTVFTLNEGANGNFDHVNIFWSSYATPIILEDVYVHILAP